MPVKTFLLMPYCVILKFMDNIQSVERANADDFQDILTIGKSRDAEVDSYTSNSNNKYDFQIADSPDGSFSVIATNEENQQVGYYIGMELPAYESILKMSYQYPN